MTLIELLMWLLIAAVCGGIGSSIAGDSRGGCLGSIALGFIGALVGGWIARKMHLPEPFVLHFAHHRFPVVWSIVGSAIVVALLHLLSGDRK